ncbi:MAG: pentapeptide repeat-containing protein [Cyanobacteria bacterium J06642_2]
MYREILALMALGIALSACGSETTSPVAIAPEPVARVNSIYFDDTDRVRVEDVAVAHAFANLPFARRDRATLATAVGALLRPTVTIPPDRIFPEPFAADIDFATPAAAIDLADAAVVQAALTIVPQNRSQSNLAAAATVLLSSRLTLAPEDIRAIPGEAIPVPVPSSRPFPAPTPNPAELAALLQDGECDSCQLQGANLSAIAVGIDLENVSLRESDLSFADLTQATLRNSNLTSAILRGATVVETDFREATLFSTDFREAVLRGAIFAASGLQGAILQATDLRGADFSDADLTDAILIEANLADANFSTATFERTQLDAAILLRADFTGVSLATTDLTDADLRGANLSTANLSGAIFANTRYDTSTQFPSGFDPERAGLVLQP